MKIGHIIIIFDASEESHSSAHGCKVILINDFVTMIDMTWYQISSLMDELFHTLLPIIEQDPSVSYLSASIVCLVRDKDIDHDEVMHAGIEESYDDQLLSFHDYIHV